MSNRSKVDFMHRYVNDVTMVIVAATVLMTGFVAWSLIYKKKPDQDANNKLCLAMSGSKATRMVDGQCQMEIFPDRWYTVKLD